MEVGRFLDPTPRPEDPRGSLPLRPRALEEFIGQPKIIENVRIMAQSAKIREGPMDHLLLSGPPGLGKTSLAMIVAQELKGQFHLSSGPAIEKKGDSGRGPHWSCSSGCSFYR